tara:strand:+ start:93 stop:323 length:231 start_codon:yes stop_codon:yes gene_type:complete
MKNSKYVLLLLVMISCSSYAFIPFGDLGYSTNSYQEIEKIKIEYKAILKAYNKVLKSAKDKLKNKNSETEGVLIYE